MGKKKRRRKSSARADSSQAVADSASKPKRRHTWLTGILAAVLATVIAGVITWVGPEIFDDPATKDAVRDAVRSDGEVRSTVEFLDPGYDLVLPSGVELTAKQREFLNNWHLDYQDPHGYDLKRLIDDLRAAGGANPKELRLVLRLEGRRNQPIHVDDVRPVNIRHTEPYDGTFLNVPPEDEGFTSKIVFNFDEVEPRARVDISGEGEEAKPGDLYFQDKTLTIEDGKQDTIAITSITTRWAVTFDIQIDYRIGDQRSHLLINNHGRQFALTPANCVDHSQLDPEGALIAPGHATYENIWQRRGDFQGIDPVQETDRFETSYC